MPTPSTIFSVGAFLVSVAAAVVSCLAYRRAEETPTRLAHQMSVAVQAATPDPEPRHAAPTPQPPFGPPMIDGMTLRNWLIWSWKTRLPDSDIAGQGVWGRVVDDFYARAAARPTVAPVFVGHDLDAIKRKFLATLLVVAHTGVDARSADTLAARHAHLRINAAAYDDTVAALAATLGDYGVPQSAVAQLVPMLTYLRGRLVTA